MFSEEPPCFFKALGAPGECRGPIQHCHLIEKSRLKAEGIRSLGRVWDRRIIRLGCEYHHSLYDRRLWQMSEEQYPQGVREYAAEVGFGWYGPRRRWARDHS